MYYVCIENNLIVSILNYEPNVPGSVEIVEITNDEFIGIENQSHFFNLTTKKVEKHSKQVQDQKEIDLKNSIERDFLNSTDWKVLRHLRQKTLNVTTSLTEQEYLELEKLREAAAKRIV